MIPLTNLYDDYINRRKLTEQKERIWVYSFSPQKNGPEQLRLKFQVVVG